MEKIYLFFLIILSLPFIFVLISPYITGLEFIHSKNTFNSTCHMERENRLEEKGLFSDKLQVKKYLEKNYPEIKFAKILHELENPEEILNLKLPNTFYLKCSTGCSTHQLVKNNMIIDKKTKKEKKLSKDILFKLSKKYLKQDFGNSFGILKKLPYFNFKELHYNYNSNKIFIEEYLDNVYEFRVYYGNQKLLFCEKIEDGKFGFYDRNWNQIQDVVRDTLTKNNYTKKPKCFEEILKFSDNFINDQKFNLIRIDFFIDKEGTDFYFCEFTFCPENCLRAFSKRFNNQHKELFT
jgi:hypothetical protein